MYIRRAQYTRRALVITQFNAARAQVSRLYRSRVCVPIEADQVKKNKRNVDWVVCTMKNIHFENIVGLYPQPPGPYY